MIKRIVLSLSMQRLLHDVADPHVRVLMSPTGSGCAHISRMLNQLLQWELIKRVPGHQGRDTVGLTERGDLWARALRLEITAPARPFDSVLTT